ncbi:MAG: PqqD family protein [Bacteroidetes bacterium]|jgi:hypothetical protein|nr:PqqD family protein [Bacteroidota bacterium]
MNINKNIAISESGFLFNPSTGDSFSTNPIGKEIITLIKEEQTLQQIVNQIHLKYAVDQDTFEKDLADFLYILKINHILKEDE